MTQCENYRTDPFAYFLAGESRSVRCTEEAKWAVKVNPPRDASDGKVRLCNHCNRTEYFYFERSVLTVLPEQT